MVLTTHPTTEPVIFGGFFLFKTGNILTTHETLSTPLLIPPVADHLTADTLAELTALTAECQELIVDREATVRLLRSIASNNPAEWTGAALSARRRSPRRNLDARHS